MNINYKADKIIKEFDYNLQFKRVYIPKYDKDGNPTGKYRPLGVPREA